jgi:hypothetical protein
VELVRIDPVSGQLAAAPLAPFVPFLTGTAPTDQAAAPGSAPQNFFMDDR